MDYKKILAKISDEYQRILGDNLVGIYVHGSIAFGCFNEKLSDIDFITVVSAVPTLNEKKALIQTLLDLLDETPTKGCEMSVVLESICKSFIYPTPFELHYSVAHLESCTKDLTEYCQDMNGIDKDLAAHFTVIKAVGYTLVGRPIAEVFGEVADEYYFDSLKYDIENAQADVIDNTVYIILNLCRVLAYKRDKLILSKATGGQWGIDNLSGRYTQLIKEMLSNYTINSEITNNEELEREFCSYMLNQILN